MRDKILVTGACGQLGTELVMALRERYGWERVIATDVYDANDKLMQKGAYMKLDVLNVRRLSYVFERMGVGQIYHLAAVLSASGEQNPEAAWQINMQGLLNVLEAARAQRVEKIFWPSSIAVFGPESMRAACVQQSALDPTTIYGISKMAGEYWCRWYYNTYGIDIRSIRYPGLISYSAKPGGGTTDYAVDIFHKALEEGHYGCFLRDTTTLPMLYMPDAVRGTIELMEAPRGQLSVHTSYNLAGLHFSPRELATEIRKHIPGLTVSYHPDFRQAIADSWPTGILDLEARRDWGWEPQFDLETMVTDMLAHLKNDVHQIDVPVER
ncbi:NAD-dependent epimerase/dehydratase family protein [Mucilaginibacter auburnensis]|uniref:Nucleoside-diphosphate-sugar epimerase n=1 Tax=Mucilaginibacter auburnensis TaxID=1457233 RepID=A0A2H9VR45_9SPHI|nr:NAD-dependent epimerase/dehydratase family protein [Mucilaginibacter auburnensis]PJJ83302.1 nucleoside-diphosphate-sugar epimerase [Mucilaginibacter auburnensis]